MKNIIKLYIVPFVIVGLSIGLGIIFNDYIWGAMSLAFGFLNAYFMAIGKWYNYIFGFLFAIVYAYVCTINGLYGLLIFTIIFYLPLQIFGLVNWLKNKQQGEVKMKSLNLKSALIMTLCIACGSTLLGFLLSLIPLQNLPFLDSTSQIINLCGVILASLRYRESWYIWLLNNVVDLTIWIINTALQTTSAEMLLITSIMYLVMNIIGLINWVKIEREQNSNKKN